MTDQLNRQCENGCCHGCGVCLNRGLPHEVIQHSGKFWPLFPLRPKARHFSEANGPIAGIPVPGDTVEQLSFDREEFEPYYMSTEAEIGVVGKLFPDCNTAIPPWHQIQSHAIRGEWGHHVSSDLTAPALVALLEEGATKRSAPVVAADRPVLPSATTVISEKSAETFQRSSRLTVNEQMFHALNRDRTLISLTSPQWARMLGCTRQAVCKTATWKGSRKLHAENKQLLESRTRT